MKADLHSFRWPAEWEPHDGTLVAWPVNQQTWPGALNQVRAAFARLVAVTAGFEPVWVLVSDDDAAAAHRLIGQAVADYGSSCPVRFLDVPVNDSWCRDYGPMIVTQTLSDLQERRARVIDWGWNAWGGKYAPWHQDARAATRVARIFGLQVERPPVVLEGGAVDGDGAGTILTTTSCLLNANRNPCWDADEAARMLGRYLGAQHVVWLPGDGIAGDDTDGHVDQLARFADCRRVLVAQAHDEDAPEASALRASMEVLAAAKNSSGESLLPIPLRLPQPAYERQQRLPMSYCNFYLVNRGVIVPMFNDPGDDDALQVLQGCFPERAVVGVDATDIVRGLGAVHCLSQQLPAGSISQRKQPGRLLDLAVA